MAKKNIEFIKFLNLVRTDSGLFSKLKRKDFSIIDHFPNLTREERDALRIIDWKHIEFSAEGKKMAKFGSPKSEKSATMSGVRTFEAGVQKLAPPNFFVKKLTKVK